MSISTQPNEMLDMILNQTGIPLAQRIRLRAVSPRFNATLEEGLQQERSLVIRVVGVSLLDKIKRGDWTIQPNDLLIKESNFTEKAIALIRRLFPHATELTIDSNSLAVWRKATELLRLYTATLSSLKVDSYLKITSSQLSVYRSLGDVINSIATLSSLYLTDEDFSGHLLHYLAPTLSRLERFTFREPIHQCHANFIAASLSSRCTHLRLDLSYYGATISLQGALNLTHLHLNYTQDSVLQFAGQLPQLTTLTLHDDKWPDLDSILKKFRPLSTLTHVTFIGIHYRRPLEPPASKAATFPHIKRLTLQLVYFNPNVSFNAQDYLSTLASWFPKLVTCALHCHEAYREGILAIQEDLPYTIELFDHFTPTFE